MKILFCLILLSLIVPSSVFPSSQTPYFEKFLDEYSPSLVSDMVPKELLNFKPSSNNNFISKTSDGIGYGKKVDVGGSYGKELLFYWEINKQPIYLVYSIFSWKNAQNFNSDSNYTPFHHAYRSIISYKSTEVCNHNYVIVQTNLPKEDLVCDSLTVLKSFNNLEAKPYFLIAKSPKNLYWYGYWNYANVFFRVQVKSDNFKLLKQIGDSALAKLIGQNFSFEKTEERPKETLKEQPKQENIPVKATVMPSALGDEQSSTAYLPASKELPARIRAETKPNTKVTFQILKSDGTAYLRVKGQKADTVQVISDSSGIAKALFYYSGGKLSSPKKYEIKVTTGEERDIVTVYVGLGLTFSRISAVQGAYGEKHPFVLSVKSSYFPNLPLAVYLSSASEKVWHGFNVGVRLKPEWVNKPANLPPDKVFTGITKITATPVGATSDNVLTVISHSMLDETVYAHTKYAYPAIKMQSDGVHSYRILGELVLTDRNGKDYGRLDEELIQKDVLTIITREQPESALTSLLCVFEATTPEQLVMLETIKTIPVFLLSPEIGEVVGLSIDLLTTITGTLCKINRGEDYERIFLDLAQFLGGQYLDNLYKPEVFNRMTERMQAAFLVAYGNYKGWDVYKKQREFEELRQRERNK